MDTLRRWKDWAPNARRARKQGRQSLSSARGTTIWQLQAAFSSIASLSDIHLGQNVIDAHPITVEDLSLDDTGYSQEYTPCFFQPLTQAELRGHPLNLRHGATKDDIAFLEECFDSADLHSRSDSVSANTISSELQRLFRGCQRIAPNNQHYTLRQLTEWIPGNLDDDGGFVRRLPRALKWNLTNAWRRGEYGAMPHCMINLVHSIQPQEKPQDDLLRGEVLAIMSAMITRLQGPYFKDHLTVPVMMFSTMGGWKARILQAHADQSGLVVRKTILYDFSTWVKASESFDVFLRLMSSAPIGDTRQLPPAHPPAPMLPRDEPPTDTRSGRAGTTRRMLPFRKRPGIDTGGYTGATIRPVVPSGQGIATHTGADPIVSAPPTISRHEEQAHESKAADVQTHSQPSDTGSSPGTANIDLRSEGANSELRSEPSNAAESQLRQVFTEP